MARFYGVSIFMSIVIAIAVVKRKEMGNLLNR